MQPLIEGWHRLRSLCRRAALERRLDEEIRFHIEREIEKHVRSGMSLDEARRQALIAFGGAQQTRELARAEFGAGVIEDLLRDVRDAARGLWRAPAFTIAAILTLALGIGGALAAFSLARGVLVLPFEAPEQLVVLAAPGGGAAAARVPAEDLRAYREQTRTFDGLAAARFGSATHHAGAGPEGIGTEEVTAGYFALLGVRPHVGHLFGDATHLADGTRPAVVSYGFWQSRFGGSPDVIGRALSIRRRLPSGALADPEPTTIVGVLPASFPGRLTGGIPPAAVWVPMLAAAPDDRHSLTVFGRIRPNQSLQSAQADVDAVALRLGRDAAPRVRLLSDQMIDGETRRRVAIFSAAIVAVLLVVLLNLVSLQSARLCRRGQELSVRAALGASRLQLVRPLVAEATLLTTIGAGVAFVLAWSAQSVVLARVPPLVRGLERVAVDGQTFVVAGGVALLAGLLIGLVPAYWVPRAQPGAIHGAAGMTPRGQRRLQPLLTFAETSLAVMLVVVAALLAYSYAHMAAIDPGFDPRHVVTAEIELAEPHLAPADRHVLASRLLQHTGALPGVERAAVTDALPLHMRSTIAGLEGDAGITWAFDPASLASLPIVQAVSAGYDAVMRIPLDAGRWIDGEDVAGGASVVVVSGSVARRLWPGENPIGRRLRVREGSLDGPWLTVVGMAGPTRHMHLLSDPSPVVYVPYTNDVSPLASGRSIVLAARVSRGSGVRLHDAIGRLTPESVVTVSSMDAPIHGTMRTPRFQAAMLGWLAAVAMFLAAVGIYSVVAFSTGQRVREIGLRMALGAPARVVVRQMMRQGATPAAAGIMAGLLGALGLSRWLDAHLFEVSRLDPGVYAVVLATSLSVSVLASWLPARRAAQVDPIAALRQG